MFFLHKNTLAHGPRYWAAGGLIIGTGTFLKTFSSLDSSFAVGAFPIFVTIGLYLYLAGIWEFKGKKINKWIVIGIPVLDILQSIIFFKYFPSLQIHTGLHLLFLIIYFTLGIFEMLKLSSAQKYLKKIFFLNAFSYTISLILVLVHVYALITNPNVDPLKITDTIIFGKIITGFLMIGLTFGFISAVNIQLNMELEGQLKSKTKFLSIIGHDLKGPVGNIISFLDILQNKSDLDETERKKYFTILTTLSQSTFHLLQNLLEWSTKSNYLSKFESERIELNQIISSNITLFKSSTAIKSINLEIIEGEQTYFPGNTNMVQTIVRNLVSNAVKFTPIGGTITITSEKSHKKVRLIVSDTGQGIKPEIINSLFKFEANMSTVGTNGEIGSGLGLPLCKELVTINNGEIKIESQEGVGTNVIVEFPAVE